MGVQELVEAVVLPMTHAARFKAIGIKPPKGVLLYGPPGTGKTLLARACARQTDAVFLKLAGPQLVQMFIGDGAKVRGHRRADGGARVSAYCFRPRSRRSDVGSGGGVTRQWSLWTPHAVPYLPDGARRVRAGEGEVQGSWRCHHLYR